MPGSYNQEVAEFPGLESWFLTVMVYGPTGTSIPLFGRYNVNRDRKLKLGILLLNVGDFAFELLMDVFQESVCWHLTEGKGNIHPFHTRRTRDKRWRERPPSTLCSQPTTGKLFCKLLFPRGQWDLILFPFLFWGCFWVASSGCDQKR